MDLYSKRRRAKKLNDPDAATVEKRDDDAGNLDDLDLDLDYSGIASSVHGDPEDDRERRREFAKSLGANEDEGEDTVMKNWSPSTSNEEETDINISYEGIDKSEAEREREADARAIAAALADELNRRGIADGGDAAVNANDETNADAGDDGGEGVEKAVETTAELVADLRESVEEYRRQQRVENKRDRFVADGGDPDATLDEFQDWLQNAA